MIIFPFPDISLSFLSLGRSMIIPLAAICLWLAALPGAMLHMPRVGTTPRRILSASGIGIIRLLAAVNDVMDTGGLGNNWSSWDRSEPYVSAA